MTTTFKAIPTSIALALALSLACGGDLQDPATATDATEDASTDAVAGDPASSEAPELGSAVADDSSNLAVYPATVSMAKKTQPSMAEPPLGGTRSFSDLGTIVTRASDTRHHYSKTPVWNANETMVLVGTLGGGQVLNADSYQTICKNGRIFPSGHRTWANSDWRYIYGAHNSNRQWMRVDVSASGCPGTVLHTYTASELGLSSLSTVAYGMNEGNTDDGDTGAVLVANGKRPFLINAKTGAVRCVVKSGGGFGRTVSDATMSHDGRTVIVNWSGYGIDAYEASSCAFRRRITTATSHYDACVMANGTQVVLQPRSPSGLVAWRLSDGANLGTQFNNSNNYTRVHISCRNQKRPGWAYVSMYNDTCDSIAKAQTSYQRIFAVKLDGSRTVQNFAWDHQPCPSAYTENPNAVPSPTGDRVWFKANWDDRSSGIHSFVAEK